jgi:hypothetical protein
MQYSLRLHQPHVRKSALIGKGHIPQTVIRNWLISTDSGYQIALSRLAVIANTRRLRCQHIVLYNLLV